MQIEMLEKVLRAAKALDISIDLRPNYSGQEAFHCGRQNQRIETATLAVSIPLWV